MRPRDTVLGVAAFAAACGGNDFELAPPTFGDAAAEIVVADPPDEGAVVDADPPGAIVDARQDPDASNALASETSASEDSTTPDATIAPIGDASVQFTPSNSALFGSFVPNGTKITIQSRTTFDTSEACVDSKILGVCSIATIEGRQEACVCRNDELFVAGRLQVTGERALVLLVAGAVRVTANGAIIVSAEGPLSGPGARIEAVDNAKPVADGPARGGSFGSAGGGPSSFPIYGDPTLVPLLGGSRGEATDATIALWGRGVRFGGGGGGALQVSATTSIVIDGIVAANGGGGQGGGLAGNNVLVRRGAGGGSGGGISIEAPEITVGGAIVANGGGGGASAYGSINGANGRPGRDDTEPAAGGAGVGADCEAKDHSTPGGAGAAGTKTAEPGRVCPGQASGGGGGIGRIRISTKSGTVAGAGVISPPASVGRIR
jgi:hypothetical protein